MTPSARTIAECRRRGWLAQNVEHFNTFTKRRLDLFGVIDIVAVTQGGIMGIQATATAAHHAHRRTKILAEPRMRTWLEAGGLLQLWSWSKQGPRGKQKRWTLREQVFTLADFAEVG